MFKELMLMNMFKALYKLSVYKSEPGLLKTKNTIVQLKGIYIFYAKIDKVLIVETTYKTLTRLVSVSKFTVNC